MAKDVGVKVFKVYEPGWSAAARIHEDGGGNRRQQQEYQLYVGKRRFGMDDIEQLTGQISRWYAGKCTDMTNIIVFP